MKKKVKTEPYLSDLNNEILKEGDFVISLRYDLGRCKLLLNDKGYFYESVETGEQVHWTKMIDAVTKNQKVRRIK